MKAFDNLKIGMRIIIAFALTIILLGAAIFMALTQANNARANYQYIIDNNIEFLTELEEAEKEVNYIAMILRQITLFGYSDAAFDSMEQPLANLEESLSHLDALYTYDDDDVTNYIALVEEWGALLDPIVAEAKAGDLEAAAEIILNDCTPRIQMVINQGEELLIKMEDYTDGIIMELNASSSTGLIIVVVLSVIGILVAVVIAVSLTKGIVKPLQEVENSVVGFSKGQLSIRPEYDSKNEFGSMADAVRVSQDMIGVVMADIINVTSNINKGNLNLSIDRDYPGEFNPIKANLNSLIDYMNDIMSQIKLMSGQVSQGAEQVSSAAQTLAQGATEQSSSVIELSNTIKDVGEQINANSIDAQNAGEMVSATTEAINASNEKMALMMESMNEIDEKSKEISKIIKTIDDIAFQTNILALNAAVEAARAGSAGKGFAVVADEVRNLAAKSAEASKSTGDLIASSISSINRGVSLAQDATENTLSVVEKAEETSALMSKIVEASNVQAQGASQVMVAIDQISAVVSTNSATSEESAAASEELSSQAISMQQLISRFELRDSRGSYSSNNAGKNMNTIDESYGDFDFPEDNKY